MKDKRPIGPTLSYAAVQGTYWMTICVSVGFAAVHLQGLGYSNTELGAILAGGNLLGALLGPWISSRIDRDPSFRPSFLVPVILALQALTLIAQLLFPMKGLPATLAILLYISFSLTVNSVNLKLYVDCLTQGNTIDFGIARGTGSFAFVLMSVLLGILVQRFGVALLPITGLVLCVLQLFSHFSLCRFIIYSGERNTQAAAASSLSGFFLRNRRFCILLTGTVLLYFSHNTIFNFLINITEHVGGNTETMGWFNAYIAALEIPVMLLFSRLFGKIDVRKLLAVSFLCFVLKSAAVAMAGTIPTLAAAFVLQAPSFALYTAAIVPYVNSEIPYEDSAKAQSLMYTMTTVGSVLASIVSGWLLDVTSVPATLWICVIVSAAGAATAFLSLRQKPKPT